MSAPTEGTFGASVRQRRTAAGLSVEDLARLADVSPSTMRNIEHNRVKRGRVHSRVIEALDRYEAGGVPAATGPRLLYVATDGTTHAIDDEAWDPAALSERERAVFTALATYTLKRLGGAS